MRANFEVQPFINVDADATRSLTGSDTFAYAPHGYALRFNDIDVWVEEDVLFPITSTVTWETVAELAFSVGNRMGTDSFDHTWPDYWRSMSKGDLIRVKRLDTGEKAWMAVEGVGWFYPPPEVVETFHMLSWDEYTWPEYWRSMNEGVEPPRLRRTHDV